MADAVAVGNKESVSDIFRESFKFYKRRRPCPDLSEVVDFANPSQLKMSPKISPLTINTSGSGSFPGLHSIDTWKAFMLTEVPGFIFIVNPFKESSRAYWSRRCLRDYTRKPNRSNLDAHTSLNKGEDIWQSSIRCSERRRCLLDKLRWVTLGYHHNWDTKHYSLDDSAEMPSDLCTLSQYIARAVGYTEYRAEAAIVNFYPPGSTLAGHTDHSEFDHLSPIISFSFGCSAIFLIGGLTKSVKPIPVYIRDGDIVIMSEACRLFYHAIPRVFSSVEVEECHRKQSGKIERKNIKLCTKTSKPLQQSNIIIKYENEQIVTGDVELSYGNSISLDQDKSEEAINETELIRQHFKDELYKIINVESVRDLSCTEKALSSTVADLAISEKDIKLFSSDNPFVIDTELANSDSDWSFVEEYLHSARININVRQVFVR